MSNVTTTEPGLPFAQSVTYPAQPTEFERQVFLREWILTQLKGLVGTDPEIAHGKADELLCEYLEAIGSRDIVESYMSIKKWYS
jgi:hypothetical protein